MRLPADARRRQTPCSSSNPSSSSNRSCARSTAAGCRNRHSRPRAYPTSSRRWPSHDAGAAPGCHAHACAAATPPAKPPTASCRPPALSRTLPQLSRKSSSHCYAHDSHRHARCPQSVWRLATHLAQSLLYRSPPARPPNSVRAETAAHFAATQTRCAVEPHTPHRSVFWIACDGIDGSKISTLGPNTGFALCAESAGRAVASNPAVKPNRARSRNPFLSDICPHRLRGYHRLEEARVCATWCEIIIR